MFVLRFRYMGLMMRSFVLVLCVIVSSQFSYGTGSHMGEQPLSRIAIHKATLATDNSAYVKASPLVVGLNVNTTNINF